MTHDNLELELEAYQGQLERMVEERTLQIQSAVRRIERTYDETLEALAAALDLRNDETAGHSRRVNLYALEIAKALECRRELCKQLARAALLHDLGKIAIPDSILLKPGSLTPEETKIMRTHVEAGYALVCRISFLTPAAEIVLAHHERFDGAGYPLGQKGGTIPLGARIFAVSDTLDAILSDRPYRHGRPFAVARNIIQEESGKQFDPEVVRAFLSIGEETWQRIRQEAIIVHPQLQRVPSPTHRTVGDDLFGTSIGGLDAHRGLFPPERCACSGTEGSLEKSSCPSRSRMIRNSPLE